MEIKLSIGQIQQMKHALGLDYEKHAFRNHYCVGQKVSTDWDELVSFDLTYKTTHSKEKGGVYYHVSGKGKEFLKSILGDFKINDGI